MTDDGSMARRPQLEVFARQHDLKILSIAELKAYRMQTEVLVEQVAQSTLPIKKLGQFQITVYKNLLDGSELTAIQQGEVNPVEETLVRLHSECLTGDVLGSARCDCGEQLQLALEKISQRGGVLLYLSQEGRGIGLANKIKAYALQDQGLDTVEANRQLGFADDLRSYDFAAQVLKALSIKQVKLLTNNPRKLKALENYGFAVEREALETQPVACNGHYLKTKQEKLGHLLELVG
jgi:3,4-dihydroxy 2-butanone 4-phosphate synthase/GTP cyclohydrolase II